MSTSDVMRATTGGMSLLLFPCSGALYIAELLGDGAYGAVTLVSLLLLSHALRPPPRESIASTSANEPPLAPPSRSRASSIEHADVCVVLPFPRPVR